MKSQKVVVFGTNQFADVFVHNTVAAHRHINRNADAVAVHAVRACRNCGGP